MTGPAVGQLPWFSPTAGPTLNCMGLWNKAMGLTILSIGLSMACEQSRMLFGKSEAAKAEAQVDDRPRFALRAGQSPPPPTSLHARVRPSERLAGAQNYVGKPAPELRVTQWSAGPGPEPLLRNEKGRVVVLYAFQSWCPGCRNRGFPVMAGLADEFSEREISFVYVQTPFEAHELNGMDAGVELATKWKVSQRIGLDTGDHDEGFPYLMTDYRMKGSPWIVMIDPWGRVRFNGYVRNLERHSEIVRELLAEAEKFDEPAVRELTPPVDAADASVAI